jgi:glycosyltransferase involved in cell wall biosynthesis
MTGSDDTVGGAPRGFAAAAVIPAHDALPFALEALDSVLAQSLAAAEVILVDDRSSDGTAAAVERRFGDRVRIVRGAFGSAAAARNAGWRAASSPWIAFLDADDLWFPDKLARAASVLGAVPQAGWFFSDGAFRTLEGKSVDSWLAAYADVPDPYAGHPLEALLEVNFVLTSSVVVRRSLLERLEGFDAGLSHAEDLDLWIRLARAAPATATRRSLVRYQHRAGGLTRQLVARLLANAALFRRLAADVSLPTPMRRRARRREALAHYKLAVAAMREGRGAEARRHLRSAWVFPERAAPVAGAWAASLLPGPLMRSLRAQRWATRRLAGPTLRHERVRLTVEPGLMTAAEPAREIA